MSSRLWFLLQYPTIQKNLDFYWETRLKSEDYYENKTKYRGIRNLLMLIIFLFKKALTVGNQFTYISLYQFIV